MAEQDEGGLESLQQELYKSLTGTQGWTQGQATGQQQGLSQKDKEEHYRQCELVAAPFMTKKGKEALAEMRRRTIEQPVFPYKQTDAAMLPYYGCAREGQNQFVRWIEYCIRVVNEGPPARESNDGEG